MRSRVDEVERRLFVTTIFNALSDFRQEDVIIYAKPGVRRILAADIRAAKALVKADARDKVIQTAPRQWTAIPEVSPIT